MNVRDNLPDFFGSGALPAGKAKGKPSKPPAKGKAKAPPAKKAPWQVISDRMSKC